MSFDWNDFNDDMRDIQKLKALNEIKENTKKKSSGPYVMSADEKRRAKKLFWIVFGISGTLFALGAIYIASLWIFF